MLRPLGADTVLAATVVPDTVPSETVSVPQTSPARPFWEELTERDLPPHGAPTLILTTTTTTRATMAGRATTRAGAMLVLRARLGLTRLVMALELPAKALLKPAGPMQVPRARDTIQVAPMTGLKVVANGLLVPADGKMLLVMATEVPPNVVAVTLPPTRVPTVTVARPLTLTVMVIWLLLDSDAMDPALTLLLRADMAGVPLRKDTLMLVPKLMAAPKLALMAVTGKMPAVMPTLPLIPLDALMADGAQLLRVQLMPSPARTVSRTATNTVAMPRTSTPMRTVLLMPVLAATVAPTLMAVALVLLATLPTLADKVLPCVSVALAEIVVLELVEVALPTNTLELEPMQMRVTVPVAAELLAVVVPATLVNALLVLTETFQMLVRMAVELVQSVVVAVTMVAPTPMELNTVALAATVVSPVATVELLAMAVLLDMAVITAATATELEEATALAATELEEAATVLAATELAEVATALAATELAEVATALAATELEEVATALEATVVTEPAATAAMVMAIELVIMVK